MPGASCPSASLECSSFAKSISASARGWPLATPPGIIVFWRFAYNTPSTTQAVAFSHPGISATYGFQPPGAFDLSKLKVKR